MVVARLSVPAMAATAYDMAGWWLPDQRRARSASGLDRLVGGGAAGRQVKVDFDDTTTYECLFKRYWKALDRKEYQKLDKLEKACHYLNISTNCNEVSDLENSEDGGFSVMKKKSQTMNSKSSTSKRSSEGNRESFAALVPCNINLIYLKRSLAENLLNQPDEFESKVLGCFVRVKLRYSPQAGEWSMLGRVTGIGKSSEEYKIGKTYTDMLLYIFDRCPVKLSMLLNEDITEAELESKEKIVHRDIVNHVRY
ncbi:hypothetical protein ZWY2020_026968 [Hordeum vulgare]|nr:hypothetical protein ZWY2020_026968 [Hordeum vulgare]